MWAEEPQPQTDTPLDTEHQKPLGKWVLGRLSSHHTGKEKEGSRNTDLVKFELISQINDKNGRFVLEKGKTDKKGNAIECLRELQTPFWCLKWLHQKHICAGGFNIPLNPSLETTNPTTAWLCGGNNTTDREPMGEERHLESKNNNNNCLVDQHTTAVCHVIVKKWEL